MSDLETATDGQPPESFQELSDAAPVRRFKFSVKAKIGISVLAFWSFMTVLGPVLAPFDPAEMLSPGNYNPIDGTYWLGTDYIGRDILSRILYGARVTMGLSFVATALAFFVGITLGSGDRVDVSRCRTDEIRGCGRRCAGSCCQANG